MKVLSVRNGGQIALKKSRIAVGKFQGCLVGYQVVDRMLFPTGTFRPLLFPPPSYGSRLAQQLSTFVTCTSSCNLTMHITSHLTPPYPKAFAAFLNQPSLTTSLPPPRPSPPSSTPSPSPSPPPIPSHSSIPTPYPSPRHYFSPPAHCTYICRSLGEICNFITNIVSLLVLFPAIT